MSEYQYTPLEHPISDLRLIRIEPGAQHEDLRLGLYIFKDYPWYIPPYRALSYVWGDATRKIPISINGKDFMITENLEGALRSLRSPTLEETKTEFPTWIDALCIDQDNAEERDEQVRRMKNIYQGAEKVVIWLGNYYEATDQRTRASMATLGIERESEVLGSESSVDEAFGLAQLLSGQQPNSWNPERAKMIHPWTQLSRLFQRTWFERLWIIQELAVATKAVVRCGRVEAPWETLERAAAWIIRPDYAVHTPLNLMHQMLPLMGAHRVNQVSLNSMAGVDRRNILTVLYNTQGAKCSDPRDRLFAISGVVENSLDVEIDYSISVSAVYRNWAVNSIIRTGAFDVLGACANSSSSGDLPSWVPDLRRPWGQDKALWTSTMARNGIVRLPFLPRQPWTIHPHEPYYLLSSDGYRLSIKGAKIGHIEGLTHTGDAVTNLQNPIELTARLKGIAIDWEQYLQRWMPEYSGKVSVEIEWTGQQLKFHKALLREDSWSDQSSAGSFLEHYAVWRGWKSSLEKCQNNRGELDQVSQDNELKNFERYLFPRIHGCQIFITDRLEFGVVAGNCDVREGDEIWGISGGLTPFILRRYFDAHRLMSPCYLSKPMDAGTQLEIVALV